jgi:hypothetical protein
MSKMLLGAVLLAAGFSAGLIIGYIMGEDQATKDLTI